MKKYKEYTKSEIKWIGEIPRHWNLTKISYYCKVKDGTHNTPQYVDSGGYPLVTQKDITFGKLDFSKTKNISKEDYSEINKRSDVSYNDIIMSMIGSIGNPSIVDTHKEFSIKNVCLFKTSLSNEVTKFIHYQLSSNILLTELNYNSRGGVQSFLSLDVLRNLIYIKPPLNEQQKIVNYLDHKTKKIDQLLKIKEDKIALLKEKRTALINHVITKGLDPSVEMKDSGVEWIGEIPKHWDNYKLKYGVLLINEKGKPTKDDVRISPENVESGTGYCFNLYSIHESDGVEFKKGDVLLNKLRLYLKKILLTESNGFSLGEMIVLRSNEHLFNKYLYYLLFNQGLIDLLDSQSTGVKLPRVSPEIILNTEVIYPPILEQKKIVTFLEKQLSEIKKIVNIEQNKIKLLKEYRQSLISEVVTGKIRVCEEDHSMQ